jgi:hypothetical protein
VKFACIENFLVTPPSRATGAAMSCCDTYLSSTVCMLINCTVHHLESLWSIATKGEKICNSAKIWPKIWHTFSKRGESLIYYNIEIYVALCGISWWYFGYSINILSSYHTNILIRNTTDILFMSFFLFEKSYFFPPPFFPQQSQGAFLNFDNKNGPI